MVEQQRLDQENLEKAGDIAIQHVQQGNYMEAGMAYAEEFANQGKATSAYVAMGAGFVGEIFGEVAKDKKRKEEVERKKIAELSKKRAFEREKAELLRKQKVEFEAMATSARKAKEDIINSRKSFIQEEIEVARTYNYFAKNKETIFIFYVTAQENYDSYNEEIVFPDKISIDINESAELYFSPILEIHPNSNGEYPYLKDIKYKISENFIAEDRKLLKIYNWSNSLEDAQRAYNRESKKAVSSNFQPIFPEKSIADFNKIPDLTAKYWTKPNGEISTMADKQKINYWLTKPDTLVQKKIDSLKIDYWDN